MPSPTTRRLRLDQFLAGSCPPLSCKPSRQQAPWPIALEMKAATLLSGSPRSGVPSIHGSELNITGFRQGQFPFTPRKVRESWASDRALTFPLMCTLERSPLPQSPSPSRSSPGLGRLVPKGETPDHRMGQQRAQKRPLSCAG